MFLFPFLLASLLSAGDDGAVRIAIMPLSARSVSGSTVETVTDILAGQLTAQGGARVMERSEMKRILHEQGFQKSGACDGRKCAVEVGRILGIDQMVVGAFGKLGDSWVLTVRRVSVETGEIVAQSTRQYEGSLSKVPDLLVAPVVADLSGVGWTAPVEEPEPVASEPAVRVSAAAAKGPPPVVDVPIRIRHEVDSLRSWVYLEDGAVRRLLGETPLDTVLRLRSNVFISATAPIEGGVTRNNWLVGPSDSADRGWRIAGGVKGGLLSSVVPGTMPHRKDSELGPWSTYRKDKVDSAQWKAGKIVWTVGMLTSCAGGGALALSMAMLQSKNSDGSYSLHGAERESWVTTGLGGVVVFFVGGITMLSGANMVEAALPKTPAAFSLQPLDRLGASGTASGLALSARF